MVGKTLGHYEILEPLGKGGMGEVYRARDTKLDRDVAIKMLPEDFATDPARLARFDVEAKAVAGINHPNIVTIYSIEEMNGRRILTMELVEGRSLDEAIPSDGLSIGEFFPIAEALAEALVAAHDRGIAHRDLKPANVMLSNDNRVKVLDFGLAKLLAPDDAQQATQMPTRALTGEGVMVGTVPYMSPEQLEGRAVDHRTDIFSLGVVLYEMATGQRPFQGNSVAATSSAILRDTPAPVTERKRELPRHLGRIISRCLQKNPDQRSQSARDVLSELVGLRREIDSGEHPDSAAPRQAPAPEVQTAHLPTTTHSIAVLPFENMSPDPEQQYFCDGMAEEVMSALAAVKDLRVAARTSAFMFRGAAIDIAEVGDKLHVGTVLMGSVRKFGNRLRITAQLVDVAEGYQLWSERYDRELNDVFLVQEEIARAIVENLKVQIVGGAAQPIMTRAADDIEAYTLYLKGRHCWHKLTESALREAIGYFEQAISQDPNYAPPYAGIAESYWYLGFFEHLSPEEAYRLAEAPASKALELDEDSAEPHTASGAIKWAFAWDWPGAEKAFQRALEISPNAALVSWHYSLFLGNVGRVKEALAIGEKVLELDPLWAGAHQILGFLSYLLRNYDEALRHSRNALQLDPNWLLAHFMHGATLLNLGHHEQAIKAFEETVEPTEGAPFFIGGLAYAYAVTGKRALALTILRDLERQGGAFIPIARVHVGLGQVDEAFAWLQRAFDEKAMLNACLPSFDWWDPLRPDPRFKAILRGMNLPE